MSVQREDYTGLGAAAWDLFSGTEPGRDHAFFEGILRRRPGPALDVGCATGRLLRPYLRAGLEVEGVEPSEDMLAICRRRAAEEGLRPVLYRQSLQTLDLPRRYGTIFVPCGTLQLVIPLADVWESLRRLYAHLEPGGLLVLTSFNRYHELERETPGVWKFRARKALPDGTELEKQGRVESRNLLEQTLTQTVRYLRLKDGRVVEEQRCDAPERWYFPHELTLMLEQVGFRDVRVTGGYTMEPAHDGHDVMAFFATRAAD